MSLAIADGQSIARCFAIVALCAAAFTAGCDEGPPPAPSGGVDEATVAPPSDSSKQVVATAAAPGLTNRADVRTFVDAAYKAVPKDQAVYVRVPDASEPVMHVKSIPDFYGNLNFMAEDTALVRYTWSFRPVGDDDKIAFSVGGIAMKEDPTQFMFDGAAVWYDEAGNVKAKGAFDGGNLQGPYQTFNRQGEVVDTVVYDAGEVVDFDRFRDQLDSRIYGIWAEDGAGTLGGVKQLVNEYRDDGTVRIWTQELGKSWSTKTLRAAQRGEATTWQWRAVPAEGDAAAVLIEYYQLNKLIGRSRMTFNDGGLQSTVVYHTTPAQVGRKFNFVPLDQAAQPGDPAP